MKGEGGKFGFRGTWLLACVAVLYVVLFLTDSEKAAIALGYGGDVLLRVLPIFVLVIFVTASLNYYIKPRQFAARLGKESGMKGLGWALVAGVVSHGPMYAWYPLLEGLRSHGVRDGLLIVFFASRAIKVPLLPIMIDYFGWTFTLVLSMYILLLAPVQGWLFERTEKQRG